MDQLISELGISKGSASQGLKFLRQLGAIKTQLVIGDRRDHFVAEVKSKKLMGGFIREKLIPALDEGEERIGFVKGLLAADGLLEDQLHKDQVTKLETWNKKLRMALPLINKVLGE